VPAFAREYKWDLGGEKSAQCGMGILRRIFAPKVLALVADGRSYRPIARELDLSKNTVLEIVKRNRATSTES
jgi:hypothetical protein